MKFESRQVEVLKQVFANGRGMIGGKDNQGMRVAIVDDNPADIDCLRDYSKKFEEESGEVIHFPTARKLLGDIGKRDGST